MPLIDYLPIVSTVVTFAFAAAVLVRYARRGGLHLLMWGIGLILYGLGTLAEAWLFFQYDPFWLRLWYLCGAILTSAWLGQGTVWLLVRRRGVAQALTVVLALLSLFAIFWVFTRTLTDVPYDLTRPVSGQYQAILVRDGLTIALLVAFTFYGTAMLVGGAIYSAYVFWRKRVMPHRVTGNVLIAAGALSPAIGGLLVRRGLGDVLFISELVGAALMFAGFLIATRSFVPGDLPAQAVESPG
jgi:hypothetical protein